MPSVEALLKEAESAIESGRAANGQWPSQDPTTTFWWAQNQILDQPLAPPHAHNPSSLPSSPQYPRSTTPSSSKNPSTTKQQHDSLDDFLAAKSPSIARRFDKVETLRLKHLKSQREKSQQLAQSAPLLDLHDVRPKVSTRHLPQQRAGPIGQQTNNVKVSANSSFDIDQDLLQQAFAYGKAEVVKVEPSAFVSAGKSAVGSNKSLKRSGRKAVLRKSSGKLKGVKASRSKQKRAPFRAELNSRGEDESKAVVRTEDLVRQLTNGTYLRKLQKELAQSKESMKHSDAFIRQATAQWFRSTPAASTSVIPPN